LQLNKTLDLVLFLLPRNPSSNRRSIVRRPLENLRVGWALIFRPPPAASWTNACATFARCRKTAEISYFLLITIQVLRLLTDNVGTVTQLITGIKMTITSNTTTQTALQEAKETTAQTQAEAAKGDQQAVRKLATEKAAQEPANTIDSNRGLLSAKA